MLSQSVVLLLAGNLPQKVLRAIYTGKDDWANGMVIMNEVLSIEMYVGMLHNIALF